VQEEGGSKVYPKPMFDFNERRQVCIDKLKKAYDVGMYGMMRKRKMGPGRRFLGTWTRVEE
jgi:cryptochrome